ncbi:MAG: nicotinate-nucleotide adenylyltransferase [Candidatus Eremiobacteraeota bacterium]|nr:nicotinate-nucleotide adenylyltransferase [Candidatus Eremiobacteraeota bacterium]
MSESVGLMGGTFNPIHIGHLIAAEEARQEFCLDRILFIPNRIPPHRQNETGLLNGDTRYLMVNIAISSNPAFRASRIELDRPSLSYTYDTLVELKKTYPNVEFSFITGVDSLLQSPWHKLDDLLKLLKRFIAVTRPGFDEGRLVGRKVELGLSEGDKIKVLKIPGIDISSTKIRERIRNGKSIKYMVPDAVESFIYKNHLYDSDNGSRMTENTEFLILDSS